MLQTITPHEDGCAMSNDDDRNNGCSLILNKVVTKIVSINSYSVFATHCYTHYSTVSSASSLAKDED